MTLIAESDSLLRQMSRTLHQREAELRALLQEAAGANIAGDNPPEVLDFKDVAAEETRAVVDEAAYAHAAGELSQVVAALRRVEDGTYGSCEDCGEAIDERRLRALPATPFCTACQTIHERPGTPRR
ncbi:MAG TPA: TraR/DksA family transcriptional regulator [Ramlibacter sp.]|nr:TraR/DksA family transcriptional regulator [Ramlibacter sp.]